MNGYGKYIVSCLLATTIFLCVSLQYSYTLAILHVYRELYQLCMFVIIQNLQLRAARTSTVDLSLPFKNQQK